MKAKQGLLLLSAMLLLASCGNTSGGSSSTNGTNESVSANVAQSTNDHGGPGGNGSGGPGGGGGGATQSVNETTATVTKGTATTLKDTDGNAICSGSATFPNSGVSASISAAYLIDGVSVSITDAGSIWSSASDSADQVVFLVVNGGSLTITGTEASPISITKSGSAASNGQVGDEYNFYGINSGIVVAGSKSKATLSHVSIETDANGSNAIVSTVKASVTISDSKIVTTGSAGSRGLHATYSGSVTADNVNIKTQGKSCASLATDRGGGTVTASNMTLETNGQGSPLVYSTGTISVTSSTGNAKGAQMVAIEGNSTASLDGCTFTCVGNGNRTGTSDVNSNSHTIDAAGIFIYQSMSGDSSSGTDYFTAKNSNLTVSTAGVPMFYSTNIVAEVTLEANTFVQGSSSDYFLIAEATDQWGTSGSNGATVSIAATNQDLTSYKAFKGSTSSITVTGSSFGSIA